MQAAAAFLGLSGMLALAVAPLGWLAREMALVLFMAIAALALSGLPHHPKPRFGAANTVTAARAAAAAFLVALSAGGAAADRDWRWIAVTVAGGAFAADGLDGFLARRSGLASVFGARFDMEADALLVLALSLLVYASGQAGAFVLASGAMRYLFVLAGCVVPWLRAPLPPSVRRKAICVAQTALLTAALAPSVPVTAAQICAGLGLLLLATSFAIDSVRACLSPHP